MSVFYYRKVAIFFSTLNHSGGCAMVRYMMAQSGDNISGGQQADCLCAITVSVAITKNELPGPGRGEFIFSLSGCSPCITFAPFNFA
jgi:hypothetical protein